MYRRDTPNQGLKSIKMRPKSQHPLKFSNITSYIDGKDLGDLINTWKDTAISEARLKMITVLKIKNLGFNEIQQFGPGLRYNLKSEKMQDNSEKARHKVREEMRYTTT